MNPTSTAFQNKKETHIKSKHLWIAGGEDPQDALICMSFFAKEPRIIGLICGK